MKTILTKISPLFNIVFLMLLSANVFAQTKEDQIKLREKTNLNALDSLKTTYKTCLRSERKLKRYAKKNNIPYRIVEKNGTIKQLIKIEKNGTPVYISTDEQPTNTKMISDQVPEQDNNKLKTSSE